MSDLKAKLEQVRDKIDAFIESKTDEPAEKEVWNELLSGLSIIIDSTKTKVDDIIFEPMIAIFRKRYHV